MFRIIVVLLVFATAFGCGDDSSEADGGEAGNGADDAMADSGDGGGDGDDDPAAATGDGDDDDTLARAVRLYADIVLASYQDSLEAASTLHATVDDLLADPSEDTLADARQAWLDAREPYLQTEVFRFYDGPIDAPGGGPEGLINAWPLDEAFIDYVAGDDDAGIINDPSQTIDAESLAALNEMGGEKNIATGYHLQTALDTGDQEDEHSCFSDNTHRDMVQDVRGMGRYRRSDGSLVSGASIQDVVAARAPELAQKVADRIAESLALAEALQPPFDREIALDNDEGRARVEALVESLGAQEDDLFGVFDLFGLSVALPQ